MPEQDTSKERKDLQKLQDDIKNIKAFIDAIEQVGGEVEPLKKSVAALEIAVNTAADIGDAAGETSQILKEYTDDLYRACPKDDREAACLAGIDRKWQGRVVHWTLSYGKDEKNYVTNLFIRNILRRYLPEFICKRLDSCR
jgi:hypothetical protein